MPKFKRLTSTAAINTVLKEMPAYRTGLPARDSITAVTITPMVRVLHTLETDGYDKAPVAAGRAAANDNFSGKDRKAAKLSISTAEMETFDDLQDVIGSLAPESEMTTHKPKIKTTVTSGRVQEEERNIHVDAFIYAASREADNDFHLIVGRDPNVPPETYMTMELSGLPPADSDSFDQLQETRDAYKNFFSQRAGGLPGSTYDFYDPPIAITVEGSLFFDITHATGTRPGPPSLKSRMPVIWEVHPITNIVFK